MKNINKSAARALRGMAFLLALACLVLLLDSAMKLRHRDGMSREYYRFPKGTFDVVFLGSSMMMYGILPMELYEEYGIAAYNLATGNQSLGISYYLAKDVIERDHPSLIVLDCSRAVMDETEANTSYLHYVTDSMPYFSRNRIEMITEQTKREDWNGLLFPLVTYHSRWDELKEVDGNVLTKEGMYGARLMPGVNECVPFEEPSYMENAMTAYSRGWLEKTIDLCRESGTELLLVSMPIPGQNEFFDQTGYNLRWSVTREVEALAKERGVRYINYVGQEEVSGLDPATDFFDGEHMNRWGAGKFTRLVGQQIRDAFGIADRRGEGGVYDRIGEDLERYPVYRMQASLQNANSMRRISDTLATDMGERPVEDVLVLFALNGQVNPDNMGEDSGERLRKCGISQNLHDWSGHGWLAVIDGGKVVYESTAEGHGSPDFADSVEGTAGKLKYSMTSGVLNEETGEVGSGASIRVNNLEYTTGDKGLFVAVFDKSTGKLMDACRVQMDSGHLACEHAVPVSAD